MLKQEFEKLAGYEVSNEDYYKVIEPMYMATDLDKAEFVKVIDKKRFALPTKTEMVNEMKKVAKVYEMNEDFDTSLELQRMASKYAERFYHIDRINSNDWCYISVTRNNWTGKILAVKAEIGRTNWFSETIDLI